MSRVLLMLPFSVNTSIFLTRENVASLKKIDITLEWLHKAGEAISFLMNSDCIVHLLCLFQGRWLIWGFWVLPFKQCLQTSSTSISCWKCKISAHSAVESDCTTLIFSMIPVHLSELDKHQTPVQEILYFYLNLGWKRLQPDTPHKGLCPSTMRYSSSIEKGSHFLFFKCSKDGSKSLRTPKKYLAGAIGICLANLPHSFCGFKVRVVDPDISCSLVTHWVFGFCKEEIW